MKKSVRMALTLILTLSLATFSTVAQAEPEPAPKENPSKETGKPVGQAGLTQGSVSAYALPPVTVYGVADQPPTVPVTTRFGTQFNVVTEEQISLQNSLDFYDALRNVPGVMFQKKNIIGGQTSHSLYIRGRGAGHPSPDLSIFFDDVPRSGLLFGQALADGIPVYALGGMEIYKYPQPSRFGSGYGMINFIPKYMTEDGYELKLGFEGGSFSTFAENIGMGAKKEQFDIYVAQSRAWTAGHVDNSAAWQESWYGNLGVQLFENWSLRLMSSYVSAQTEAPDSPLTGGRQGTPGGSWLADRYDTYSSLSTVTLANNYKQASGWLKGYYNDTKFFIRGEGASDTYSRQYAKMYGLRGRETFSIWDGSEFVLGFDLDRTELENYQIQHSTRNSAGVLTPVNRGPNNPRTWNFPDQTLFSPYLAASQMFGSKEGFHVVPSAGIRFYTHNLFADQAAPQAGVVLGYGHTDLNFNYARGVNYPSPVVLMAFLPNSSLPSGFDTKEIEPEIVDHFEVGITHKRPNLFTFGATYFHDNGRNRTRAYMGGPAPQSASVFNADSTARYFIDGLELSGSLTPLDGLELFAGATWLKARARGDGAGPDDRKWRDKMPYTPEFMFQGGFKWDFLEHFRLSGDFQHLQGVYQGTVARGGLTSSTVPTLTKRDKLPDINVVNLRLDYMFDYEPWHLKQGKIFIAVDNVLNAKYAYAMEKATNGSRDFYWMPGTSVMAGMELQF